MCCIFLNFIPDQVNDNYTHCGVIRIATLTFTLKVKDSISRTKNKLLRKFQFACESRFRSRNNMIENENCNTTK